MRLTQVGFDVAAVSARDLGETKLLVRRDGILIKVEVNTVMRAVVNPTQTRSLSDVASRALMADLELALVSPEDVYGGKTRRSNGPAASARSIRRDAALRT